MYKISIYVDGLIVRQQAIRQARQELKKLADNPKPSALAIFKDQNLDAVTTIMVTQEGSMAKAR